MADVKAGVAYVDVKLGSVERFKRQIKEEVEKAGKGAGETLGNKTSEQFETVLVKRTRKISEDTSKSFSKDFSEGLARSSQIIRGSFVAWLLPAAVAAGPLVGGILGGLIVSSLPIGVMAGGIALVADDPRIKTAGERVGTKLKDGLKSSARGLVQPVEQALKNFEKRIPQLLKPIHGAFLGVQNFIVPLGDSITNAVQHILNGINFAIQRSGPIIAVFNRGIERLGKAIGDLFIKITEDPEAIEGMTDALDDLFGVLVLVIEWLGNFIVSASRAYAQLKDAWGDIKSWFSGTIVPSLKRAGDQAIAAWNAVKKWFGGLPKWFRDRWNEIVNFFVGGGHRITSATSSAVARVLGFFVSLPGKIINALAGLASKLYNLGWAAGMGFFRGLGSVAGGIIQRARSIANSVVQTIQNALSIFSPSRVMEKLGEYTMMGFEKGLANATPDISSYLPKGIPSVTMDVGGPSEPQMDKSFGTGLHIENYYANKNVDPWRQAEDWYFLVTARGGVA